MFWWRKRKERTPCLCVATDAGAVDPVVDACRALVDESKRDGSRVEVYFECNRAIIGISLEGERADIVSSDEIGHGADYMRMYRERRDQLVARVKGAPDTGTIA